MSLFLIDEAPTDNFWRLSSSFYEQADVKDLLLKLQNQHDKNVNEVLFALWFSMFYQAELGQADVSKIIDAASRTKSWVSNIRSTRFDLESQWQPPYPEKIKQARAAMLETEVNIEKLHQQKLVEGLPSELAVNPSSTPSESCLQKNLQLICGELKDSSYYELIIAYWLEYCCQFES